MKRVEDTLGMKVGSWIGEGVKYYFACWIFAFEQAKRIKYTLQGKDYNVEKGSEISFVRYYSLR